MDGGSYNAECRGLYSAAGTGDGFLGRRAGGEATGCLKGGHKGHAQWGIIAGGGGKATAGRGESQQSGINRPL